MKISKTTVLEFVAEFLATMLLALMLYLAPMLAAGIEPFFIAFAIMVIWYVFSPLSKTHMNPAVTLGEYLVSLFRQAVAKKFYAKDLITFLAYIVVQLLAFFAAFPIANWVKPNFVNFEMIKNGYGTSDQVRQSLLQSLNFSNTFVTGFDSTAFVLEMLGTFFVVFVFLKISTSEKFKSYLGFIWGLAYFTGLIITTQFTGGALNPWKSLVAAVIEKGTALSQLWVFIVAQILGTLIAAVVYAVLRWLEIPKKARARQSSAVRASAPKAVRSTKVKRKAKRK